MHKNHNLRRKTDSFNSKKERIQTILGENGNISHNHQTGHALKHTLNHRSTNKRTQTQMNQAGQNMQITKSSEPTK